MRKKTNNAIDIEKTKNAIKNAINTLQGDSGRRLLAFVEQSFSAPLFVPGDPYGTHVRVGEQRVIDFLKQLQVSSDRDIDGVFTNINKEV